MDCLERSKQHVAMMKCTCGAIMTADVSHEDIERINRGDARIHDVLSPVQNKDFSVFFATHTMRGGTVYVGVAALLAFAMDPLPGHNNECATRGPN